MELNSKSLGRALPTKTKVKIGARINAKGTSIAEE